ncbi:MULTISPECIES: T9SS type B sorting domain-containing protein [unclassified Tenacibaculum]|uniref:T9SS type B sorting domain-containing protein n=1 Tax=unclassified Tenacibaculum TaxID=2635139 RepID=UPI001F1D016B|nr:MULTISPECIES: T9SS type B sorting domain-containing protein [unclassified Tenacibaculum]MCF2876028.1 T9SS type B sorting domain-containing protein [Tenacibaculum sp. Cn5-1]MCF2936103.1 T9SS type B sorting domain-containing protein [Tenacibaculum sp. Cn5-34]MCG7512664.1 T9SS type B sorting domain-containing protein [Tenacibaculum sp. Cn5-46]
MKSKLYLLLLLLSTFSYSQCFDCGTNIGEWTDDYVEDIDKTSDGVVLTTLQRNFYSGIIYKFDNNCNLVWSFNKLQFAAIHKTTIDNNNNVFSLVSNKLETSVDGILIYKGMNLVKISSNGELLWSKKLGGQVIGARIHYSNDHLIIHGRFLSTFKINNEITLTSNGGENHYLAKFKTNGNLVNAISYGKNNSTEIPLDSDIDTDGNLYLTGRYDDSAYLIKFDFDLTEVWKKEISNRNNNGLFYPSNVFFNKLNNKIYVWGNYFESANLLNYNYTRNPECVYGKNSILGEFDAKNGELNNSTSFNNCSILELPTVSGNWRDDNVSNGYMASKDNELYVLSSFRKNKLEFSNNIVTSTFTGAVYHEDLILFKVNLDDFSTESILQTKGENNFSNPYITYRDGPGPILINKDDIYLTSFFQSLPLYINNTVINNNSGNMDTDILFYKYSLDKSSIVAEIDYNNTCYSETTDFLINGEFDAILWDFDDPTTGTNNTSTLKNPNHIFSTEGIFNVTATVTCGTQTEIISTQIVISSTPTINNQLDLYACEDSIDSGFSSNFNTSNVQNQIIGNQTNVSIEYYDENGVQLSSPLPNPMTNTTQNSQQITARVFFTNNSQCYTETTFQLHTQSLPELKSIENINSCDIGSGFSNFDLTTIQIPTNSNEKLEFYDSNYNLINHSLYSNYINIVPNQDLVYVRLVNSTTDCYSEKSVSLKVNPLPIANNLDDLIGCDDDNDGISNSFNTSKVESQVLGGQSGMTVTYYDQDNNLLPSPLPNSYTNTNPFNEIIRVRVTNSTTKCFSETSLNLITSTQPKINKPNNVYACDEGNGFSVFSIPNLTTQIIGNQPNLKITYFDEQGNILPDSFPLNFKNTVPYDQLINVKVENTSNPSCFSETNFHLLVNRVPTIELQKEYIICGLQKSLTLNVDTSMSSYLWTHEDGSIVSQSSDATLVKEGDYVLEFTKTENGVDCKNYTHFKLTRSELPKISNIEVTDLSDNNTLEIIVTGDGVFEYSINGQDFQSHNVFENLKNETYTVHVRDKNGCGEDSKEVTIIDYPKFFTPNNDGINDFWEIKGLSKFPNSRVLIFDRYGKVLEKLTANKQKWYGFFNGAKMPSNEYWFNLNLGNGKTFSGHFSLRRS